jgi:hypothetical protein
MFISKLVPTLDIYLDLPFRFNYVNTIIEMAKAIYPIRDKTAYKLMHTFVYINH